LRLLLGLFGVGYSLLEADFGQGASISNEILKSIAGGTVGNAAYDLVKGGGVSAWAATAKLLQAGDGENLNHDLQRAARKAQLTATLLAVRACLAETKRAHANQKSLWAKAAGLLRGDEDEQWLKQVARLWQQKIERLPNEVPPPVAEREQIIDLFDPELNLEPTAAQQHFVARLKEDALAEIRAEQYSVSPLPAAAYQLLEEAIREGWNEFAADTGHLTALNLSQSLYKPEQKSALVRTDRQFDWFSLLCGFFNEEYKTNGRVARAMQKYLLLEIRAQGKVVTNKQGLPVAADVFLAHFQQFGDSFARLEQLLTRVDEKQDEILGYVSDLVRVQESLDRIDQRTTGIERTVEDIYELEKRLASDVAAIKQARVHEYLAAQMVERAVTGVVGDLIERDPFFVDREAEQASLLRRLAAGEKMLVVTATSGYGKTSLATEVLHELAPHGELRSEVVQGVLLFYCRESGLTLRDVCVKADRLVSRGQAHDLTATYDLYKQGKRPLSEVLSALLSALSAAGNVWLVFDNFETMLDGAGVADEELRTFFVQALRTANRLHFLLTSQKLPQFVGAAAPGRLDVKELPADFAKKFLRDKGAELKARGIDCGLAEADEQTLDRLLAKITSVPMALVSFAGYLETAHLKHGTVLTDVLADERVFAAFRAHDARAGAMSLIERQFLSHNDEERLLLKALSIFPRPVPFPLLSYVLPILDENKILTCLTSVSLVRRIGRNTYELLPQAKEIIAQQPEPPAAPFSRRELHTRAADVYAAIRKPEAQWKTIEDLAPQFEEIYHCQQAGLYDRAAYALDKQSSRFLQYTGYSSRVLAERLALPIEQMSERAAAYNLGWLMVSYTELGEKHEAVRCGEESVRLFDKIGDKQNQGIMLGTIGTVYEDSGDPQTALKFYKEALAIHRDPSNFNRVSEGITLSNIGSAYIALGEPRKAIVYLRQALNTLRRSGQQVAQERGRVLGNIGIAFHHLDKHRRALAYYERALQVLQYKEGKGRVFGGRILGYKGKAMSELGERAEAIRLIEEALEAARLVEDKMFEEIWVDTLKGLRG
jgi:tetratricopeptide (TPR) repeat protein